MFEYILKNQAKRRLPLAMPYKVVIEAGGTMLMFQVPGQKLRSFE